jgi:uncharacterized membrane protein
MYFNLSVDLAIEETITSERESIVEQYIDLRILYVVLVLMSVLFITFAIGTVKSIDLFAAAIFAAKWPSVVGTIEEVSLQKHEESSSDESQDISYRAIVKYEYFVDDRAYTNDTIAFGYGSSENVELHRAILNKLQEAEAVVVRYDPANPSRSSLAYGIHSTHLEFPKIILFTTSLLFVIISIVLMIMHESGAIENGSYLQKLFDLLAGLRTNHQQLPTAIGVFLFLGVPFLWDIFDFDDRLLDTIEVVDL